MTKKKYIHYTTLGKFGTSIPRDANDYIHLTWSGWLDSDRSGKVTESARMTKQRAQNLAKQCRELVAEAIDLLEESMQV